MRLTPPQYFLALITLCTLSFFTIQANANGTEPIRSHDNAIIFSYWEQATPPFVFVENETLTSGIIKDIGDLIGQHLNRSVKYIRLPVARIEPYLKDGMVDADCVTSPIWKEAPNQLEWSPVLFDGSDRFLVANNEQSNIKNFSDLIGKRLGIYNGYVYHPEIMKMIKDKTVHTTKIKDLTKGIELLKLKRIDTLIDFGILIKYQLLKQNLQQEFKLAELHADNFTLSCAYSKKAKINPEAFNEAISQLIAKGKIEEVLSKYR